jgi:hypothetical protein
MKCPFCQSEMIIPASHYVPTDNADTGLYTLHYEEVDWQEYPVSDEPISPLFKCQCYNCKKVFYVPVETNKEN